jgi:hypothetical protein
MSRAWRVRFRLETSVSVEVDSLEMLDELEGHAADAVTGALNEWLILDPQDKSVSGGAVDGLDDESRTALEAQAATWEHGVSPIERVRRRGPRPVDGRRAGVERRLPGARLGSARSFGAHRVLARASRRPAVRLLLRGWVRARRS